MGQVEASFVTKRIADDANGCNIDGEEYYVTRFFSLTSDLTIKVGLVAQAPIGQPEPFCGRPIASMRKAPLSAAARLCPPLSTRRAGRSG